MPTASIVRRRGPLGRRASLLGCALLGLAGPLAGCLAPGPVVVEDLLLPLTPERPWMPEAADLAAARLARMALVAKPVRVESAEAAGAFEGGHGPVAADPRVEAALAELVALAELAALPRSEALDDLVPLATDLRNATLDDPIADRAATRALRRRWGLDPRLEERLDRTIRDDPLRLAGRRRFDGWHRLWARTFNAVAEPLGSSAITGFVLAPFQLANSGVHYLAEFSNSEPLSTTGRQALALRQEFLARHPDTALSPDLDRRVEADVVRLERTLARRRVRAAREALDADQPRLARHHAQAALSILAAHPDENARTRRRARDLAERAEERVARVVEQARRALESRATAEQTREAEWALAGALLAGRARPERIAPRLADYAEAAGEAGRGRVAWVRALVQHEEGFESAARETLAQIDRGRRDQERMARHARALLRDDWQNPHGAFERLRRKGRRDALAWRLAGEWVRRPRYPNLPAPVAYLIDTPTIAMTIVMAPLRALISPWTGGVPDFQRGTALAGYRYLVRHPDGEQQRRVIDWLYGYELSHERWDRALRLADSIPDFDPERRAELVEQTAEDRLARVDELDRRDSRESILTGVAREFPDSEGGRQAGLRARAEREDASPQHIRITRGFLIENPSVAGTDGIGLLPSLLNDDPADGELHPEGVVLRGGRVLEIRLVAEGGDDDAPPEPRLRKVSRERLARIAAALDEAVQRNGLIDPDARQRPDANRDVYLERAGLGLTEDVDPRPSAESTFVYQSLRERYGLVRGRDSLLPVDLVFRGSLGDFSLGAFPRWRAPRQTPDAFLYR